ncbi:translocation/assembly module TamB domain-containing protein [Olivibacter sitiensis]|uniref:translocation/assembly module TamB domain-containing protein n=1 Tax=Olivibacter sitiensis TaxID=376470 RepID=UPI0006877FD8|nr:translocation/assembly module TamB domain-containing protein [Olivibacter sitiensis]
MKNFGRIAFKVVLWLIGSIIGLVLLIFILIRIPAVQNFIVQKAVTFLENKIKTPVRIARVSLDLPKLIVLEGVYFEDQKQDTLLAGDKLMVDISLLKLLKNKVEINEIDLEGITAKIDRTLPDSAFNFDYIIRAFVSEDQEEPKPEDTTSTMEFSIDKIKLDRIRLVYHDEIIGTDVDFNLVHFDTRIKVFDLNNMNFEIPNINIKGINTNLKQWQVAQAEDIPSPDDLGVEQATGDTAAMPGLKLGRINLEDIRLAYNDESSAMDAKVAFKKLLVNINSLDLNKELVDIKDLLLQESKSSIVFGKTNPKTTATASTADTSSINWQVKVGDINLANNELSFYDANQPKIKQGMDYSNIDIKQFDLKLENLFFSMDSISGNLNQLNFKDRSGLELKRAETDFAYNDHGATLSNLLIETPNTLIRDRAVVQYASLERLSDEIGNMSLDVNVNRSHVGMKDILLLMPDIATMPEVQPLRNQTFKIHGKINGKVNDLRIPNLEFSTLNQTKIHASAHIKGLPDTDKLYADLVIKDFRTSKGDLDRMLAKGILPDSINIPQNMQLQGSFKGGMSNFITSMHLKTSNGNADVDAKYNVNGQRDTSYNANLNIADLDVGHIMMDTTLGKVSFEAELQGTGLDPSKMVAEAKATLISAEAMGYTYKDIQLEAQANAGDMTAKMNSDDPNIQFNMDASANMQGQYPRVSARLMIDSVNAQNLNLTTDEIRFHGQIDADFETADPDFLNGRIDLAKAILVYNNERFVFDTISVVASATEQQNRIQLVSDFLNAHVTGKYKLTEIANALQDVIAVYYHPEETEEAVLASQQNNKSTADTTGYSPAEFEFGATFTRSALIQKVVPDLTEMQPINIDGYFNSDMQLVMMKAVAPRTEYAGTQLRNIVVDVNTADSTLYYSVLVGEVALAEFQLINTILSGSVKDNNVDVGLWIKDKKGKEQYHIGANVLAQAKDFVFSLKEDGLMLNYDSWQVNPDNAVIFGGNGFLAHQFDLSLNGQSLHVVSQDSSYNAPLRLDFENFKIETFTNIIESNTLVFGGSINGNATIDRLESSPVFTSDISINQFTFGNDPVGDINIQVNNLKENTFTAKISITGNDNDVVLSGDYVSPPNGTANMDFTLDVNRLNMSTIQAFSLGNLRRTTGAIHGSLDITGTTVAPRINGDLIFDKASLNVSMLNATFNMDQQRINFNDRGIRFNRFTLADSVGNKAIVNGSINTTNYTDYALNLDLTADDFQVLNSTIEDNDLFYGLLFLDTDMHIRGPMTAPSVNGSLKINGNTDMTYIMPLTDPGMVDREGIVEFVSLAPQTQDSISILNVRDSTETSDGSNAITGMNISLNLEIEKNAAFHVVVDPGTGDQLNIKGQALLSLGIEPGGEMTLAGTYEVEEGDYSLSFSMINRKFLFKKGSTITWGGDVMDADLNMTAIYNVQAQPIDLVQNQMSGQNSAYFLQRIPFNVNLIIGGKMMKPIISFDIDLGTGGNLNTLPQDATQLIETRLAELKENESEMNKQTFALLVLGRFIADNPFSSAGGSSTETMVRSSVSSLLSNQLNKLAGDLVGGVELNFDLQSTADDYSTGSQQTRTDLNVGVSKRLLDDRLKVTVGSSFELEGSQQPGQKANNIAGDINIEYQLSRDGRYVARVYRVNQYQVTLQGQFIETGLGFIVNMSYDEFREIFMRAKNLEKLNQQRADSVSTQMREYMDRRRTDSLERRRRIPPAERKRRAIEESGGSGDESSSNENNDHNHNSAASRNENESYIHEETGGQDAK